jgi:hypothetical protein
LKGLLWRPQEEAKTEFSSEKQVAGLYNKWLVGCGGKCLKTKTWGLKQEDYEFQASLGYITRY